MTDFANTAYACLLCFRRGSFGSLCVPIPAKRLAGSSREPGRERPPATTVRAIVVPDGDCPTEGLASRVQTHPACLPALGGSP
jgi:hypothetical protein